MTLDWHPGLSKRQRRKCQSYSRYLLIVVVVITLYQIIRVRVTNNLTTKPLEPQRPRHPHIKQQARYWRDLYSIILNNDPTCDSPPEFVGSPPKLDIPFNPNHTPLRPDHLWIQADDLNKLKVAHKNFISEIRHASLQPFYDADTRGIVMTVGGNQLPVLTISLRMLRRTGCNLPIEVFLGSASDYNAQVCEEIFSTLNARCFVIEDILTEAQTGVHLENFQYKVVALLFSSFEHVLLLDSDNFPIVDPAPLFENLPFNQTGMVLWPDFWYASESPYFFDIASLGAPPSLSIKPSSESGQMLFSKSQHNLTLALATYYNYYGPQTYYPLFAQGGPGQGDKESFGWAATVMHEEYYTVHEPVLALGHSDSNGQYFGSAMVQHDPTKDFINTHQSLGGEIVEFGAPIALPEKATPSSITGHANDSAHFPQPLFIHANFPKFDPSSIFSLDTQPAGKIGPCFDSNGTAIRTWLSQGQMESLFGYDVERAFWQEIQYVACQYENVFENFKGKREVCAQTVRYIRAVFGGLIDNSAAP